MDVNTHKVRLSLAIMHWTTGDCLINWSETFWASGPFLILGPAKQSFTENRQFLI